MNKTLKKLTIGLLAITVMLGMGAGAAYASVTINATTVLGSAALTLTGATASTWSTSAGVLTVQGHGGLIFSTVDGNVAITPGNVDDTITIGKTTGTAAITVGNSSGNQALNLGTGAGVSTVDIATGAAANAITIGGALSGTTVNGTLGQAYTFTGTTGGQNAMTVTLTDSTAQTSGMNRGIVIVHNVSGAKSGTADSEGLNVDTTLTANTNQVFGTGVYITQSGGHNYSQTYGSQVYLENLGSGTLGTIVGSYIGINSTNLADGRHTALRLVNHSGTAKTAILLEGGWTTGIDLSGVGGGGTQSAVATDIRLHDGATIHNTTADLLTITEATIALVGKATQATTLTGGTAANAFGLTVTDTGSHTSGYNRGIYVGYTHETNNITSTGEVNGMGVDMTLKSAVPYSYNLALYASASGDPVIGFASAVSVYLDDLGSNLGALAVIDLGTNLSTNAPADRYTFMRFRNHTATTTPESIFRFEGANTATYLVQFETGTGLGAPYAASGPGATGAWNVDADGFLKVKIGADVMYIPLFK